MHSTLISVPIPEVQLQGRLAQFGSALSSRSVLTDPTMNLEQTRIGSRRASDRGGDRLRTATSLRPYLQGFAPPGVNRSLKDTAGRNDPDFYRLFDNAAPNTFQQEGLLLSCNLQNFSLTPISIALLDRQGNVLAGSRKTVRAGKSFVYPEVLSHQTYYIQVISNANGRHAYELNLSIINS